MEKISKFRKLCRKVGDLNIDTDRKIFLFAMILMEYMFFFSFLFTDFKVLSFGIMMYCGINGLIVNKKINWRSSKMPKLNKLNKYITNAITFFIVIMVGSLVAKEINKQLPRELRINQWKILLQALLFSLLIGLITYLILNVGGVC